MKRVFGLVFLFIAFLVLASCGETVVVDEVIKEEVSKEVSAGEGGTVSNSDDSVKMTIPADALDGDTRITMTIYESSRYDFGTGEEVATKVIECEPSGTVFKKPIMITMTNKRDIRNKLITAAVFNEEKGEWSYSPTGAAVKISGYNEAGDPIMTTAAGDPIMLSAAGDPIMMSAAGDPIMLASAGDPIMVTAAGDPIMNSAAGDPIMMTTGHFTTYTFIALGDDWEPRDSGDEGDDDEDDDTDGEPYVPECGNGIIDEGEECDHGEENSDESGVVNSTCRKDCTFARCGDGIKDADEGCDDGNNEDGDYCSADCQTETGSCGDGEIQGNEACDDGNTADGDYCSADCKTLTGKCGDGEIQGNEECDNGETGENYNGKTTCIYGEKSCTVCTASCKKAEGVASYCGDGVTDSENNEACDNASDNGRTACAYGETSCTLCTAECQTAAGTTSFCGDGSTDTAHGEACDNASDNGRTACAYGETSCTVCTTNCQTKVGKTSYCGDGVKDTANGEVCDNASDNGRTACAYSEKSCTVCTANCQSAAGTTSFCGDGEIQGGEACDNGSDNGRTACAYGETSCTLCTAECQTAAGTVSFCGDGIKDASHGEACDSGAENGRTACAYGEKNCTLCTVNCQTAAGTVSYCGDGIVDEASGEVCDDGNAADGDYCSSDCREITGFCGDGIVQGNEACDKADPDAEVIGSDFVSDALSEGTGGYCSDDCHEVTGTCGDGIIQREDCEGYENCAELAGINEACDNGAENGRTACAYGEEGCDLCTSECQIMKGEASYCGDGIIDETNNEACDNGSDNGRTDCAYGETSCTVCTTACRQIQGATSYCGDGRVDAENNEICDEGSLNGTYGHCNATCSEAASRCGDGVLDSDSGEECDDGELNGTYNHCNSTCSGRAAYCGDGNIDEGHETCDNGAKNGETTCAYGATSCTVCTTECQENQGSTSFCGDAVKDEANGEQCDNGSDNGRTACAYGETSCTVCTAQCLEIGGAASYCGDGRVDSENNETCDEGSLNGTYGHCNAACSGRASFCGDGVLDSDSGEQCDDGSLNGTYNHCNSTCSGAAAYCGDGRVDEDHEACDNGAKNGETKCAYGDHECTLCSAQCQPANGETSYCGDGTKDEANGEQCDNGAENGRTDCAYGETSCTVCTTGCLEIGGAASYCGDGKVDAENNETCDEGSLNGTYGHCNATCSGEASHCGDGTVDTENGETCDDGELNGSYGKCNETCNGRAPYCGDGNIDEDHEACDNGAKNGETKCAYGEQECTLCTTSCQPVSGETSFCGDNNIDVENGEACDSGELNGMMECTYGETECQRCSETCQNEAGNTSFCGDGNIDEDHEACDNGAKNGETKCAYGEQECTLCSAQCQPANGETSFCGDGTKDEANGEQCDNGEDNGATNCAYGETSCTVCTTGCLEIGGAASYCGDGKVDTENNETCDEGSLNGTYGHCNATCSGEASRCGDGNVDTENGETCDDGELNGTYNHCNETCSAQTAYCGDGRVDEGHETCDNGSANGETKCAYGATECQVCTTSCQLATGETSFCGDNNIDVENGEACDSGELNGMMECTYGETECQRCAADCQFADGVASYCGDGEVQSNEACDHGFNNGVTDCLYGETSCALCSETCQNVQGAVSYCGDAVKDEANGEQCDNGAENGATDCAYGETSCTVCTTGCLEIGGAASFCGDGKVDAENNETCDEGSLNGTYGHCNATCSGDASRCGDGILDSDSGEQCDDGELNGSYGKCNETCNGRAAYCGDGNIDEENDEGCDNGAKNGETKCAYGEQECTLCTTSCQPVQGETSFCGDNNIDVANGEACDSGELNGMMECTYGETECQRCSETCQNEAGNTSFCGDGRVDEDHEACDNGAKNGETKCAYGDHECTLCTTQCQPANGETSFCGDAVKDEANGEQCDNGSDNGRTDCAYGETSCTVCTTGCLEIGGAASFCGDGKVDTENNETCDEGSLNGTYGHCNATCSGEASHCGDGNIDTENGETCDDGELNGSYGKCNATCNGRAAYCGDGNIDEENDEGCDNGAANGETKCAYGATECQVCTTSCQPVQGETSFCGDAVKDEANGEQCDNGELNGQTNCAYGETECTVCTEQCREISGAASYCGDGNIDEGHETCDNGAKNGETKCAYGATECEVCTTSCGLTAGETSYCGDAVKDEANGEQCDNGELNGATDCAYGETSCTVCTTGCLEIGGAASYCGDGRVDSENNETCDEGSLNGTYGHCNATCSGEAAHCGDGNIDTENGETCDEGELNGSYSHCNETCSGLAAHCGDGNIDSENGEACDNGAANGETKCAYGDHECTLCTTQCQPANGETSFCGDNNIDVENGEACDSGELNGMMECTYGETECQRCSAACQNEAGNTSFCGDGRVDEGHETCDNGADNGRTNCAYGEHECTLCTADCQPANGETSFCGDGIKDAANGEQCDNGEDNGATDCAYGETSCTLCTSSCQPVQGAVSYCGDGRIDETNNETCDEGANLNGTYGHCNATCNGEAAHCGDGNIDSSYGETCDDGELNGSYGKCNETCNGRAPYCGDGNIDEGHETCDNGAANGATECAYGEHGCTLCTADCQPVQGETSFCGDGHVDAANGEQCDSGEDNGLTDCAYGETSCTLCTTSCQPVQGVVSYCGDGRVDAENNETCDEGSNLNGTYGHCNATCSGAAAHCGDGNIDSSNGETCDDGELNGSYEHCNETCNGRAPYCGDGNIDEGHEGCDNGDANGTANCAYGEEECIVCTSQCQPESGITSFCGDENIDTANGEQCDNGSDNGATECAYNETECTVCTAQCREIPGAASFCGDGQVDAANEEECDKGFGNGITQCAYGEEECIVCTSDCHEDNGNTSFCGDGHVDAANGEQCDNGELNGATECEYGETSCTLCTEQCRQMNGATSFCGDGRVDEENGEACDDGANLNGTYGHCNATCSGLAAHCGDGNIDSSNGETCDDGELNGTYGKCNATCSGDASHCGDGVVDADNDEECDRAFNNGATSCLYGEEECIVCTSDCKEDDGIASYCGDGEIDESNGEQCDSGEENGQTDCEYNEEECTVCTAQCREIPGATSFCGDGRIDEENGEECDRSFENGMSECIYGEESCTYCSSECHEEQGATSYCGDGLVDEVHGETCDEGEENGRTDCVYGEEECTVCTAQCRPLPGITSYCGDKKVDPEKEACDEGREFNGSYGHCNETCSGLAAHCGDGNVDEDYETCDEGLELNGTDGHCNSTCSGYQCAEGYFWNGEECQIRLTLGNICTGQTSCYDNEEEIECPAAGEDFYGQDAQYAALGTCIPQSFSLETVGDDNIVIDNNTGLIWQQSATEETYSYEDAVAYCENLEYAGVTGWRLPALQELMTISDRNSENGVNELFSNIPEDSHGAEMPAFMLTGSRLSDEGFLPVLFFDGMFAAYSQSMLNIMVQYGFSRELFTTGKILCVYGDELPVASLTTSEINGDIVVTDSTTGLQWQKNYVGNKTWQEALSYCENLEYAGYSDWRLPNTNELASLLDFNKENGPYSYFPGIDSSTFESSTSYEGEYVIDLSLGIETSGGYFGTTEGVKTSSRSVICVRSDLPENTERQAACTGLPANAEWNEYSTITQTWINGAWTPDKSDAVYSEEPEEGECRFVCLEDNIWYEEECIPLSKTAACTGLPENAQWWSGNGTITQTFSNGEYLPEVPETVYSESAGDTADCSFRCIDNYTWYNDECVLASKTASCTALPANAQWWSGNGTITQTFSNGEYLPSTTSSFSESAGDTVDCSFRCIDNYTWYDGACVLTSKTASCTALPANAQWWSGNGTITQTFSNGEYLPSTTSSFSESAGDTADCSFKCNEHYTWNDSECEADTQENVECTGLPANAQWWNAETVVPLQTWSGTEWLPSEAAVFSEDRDSNPCSFRCTGESVWTGSECKVFPACTSGGEFPCRDAETGLVWSAITGTMHQPNAAGYCSDLEEGGATNWRLPNISELRTLVQNCSNAMIGGTCNIVQTDDPETTCLGNECVTLCSDCSSNGSGYYSKLGDTAEIWSSSNVEGSGSIWRIRFALGGIIAGGAYKNRSARCVIGRSTVRAASCSRLPANAEWNKYGTVLQNLEDGEWTPAVPELVYSEEESSDPCHFKCKTNYTWNESECEADTLENVQCSGIPANAEWWNIDGGVVSLQTWSGSEWLPSSLSVYSEVEDSNPCSFKCADDYFWDGSQCVYHIRDTECTGISANAQWWDETGVITQTWNGTEWLPSAAAVYSEEEDSNPCSFRCVEGAFWNDEACVTPVSVGNICTGQTECFNGSTSIACPAEGEEFYGQDAQYASITGCRTRSYATRTVAGEKIVLDKNTGLQWQQTLSTETMDWSSAISYCENLTYAGYTDWRLATPNDMLTLRTDPDNHFISSPFTNGSANNNYWLNKENPDNTDNAISANFYGIDGNSAKTNEYYAICVRGNAPLKGSFETDTVGNDEIVIDSSSGFVWKKTPVAELTWFQALAYCENLEYGGYDDWRLPNKNELDSLLDYDNEQTPFTDFPANVNGEFWTTTSISGGSRVGDISLTNGTYNVPTKYEKKYTLCLRSDIVGNPTRQAACQGLPAGAQWNSVSSITQTWNGSQWTGVSREGVYNETASTTECRFVCKEHYTWNGSECEADTQEEIECSDIPANAEWWNGTGTITQTWSGTEWLPSSTSSYSESVTPSEDCSFKCADGYEWDGEQCVFQPLTLGNICTGQTLCYNDDGDKITCPTSSSADFYGQDAQHTSTCTAQSFTVGTGTQAGTVIDNNTGLIWEQSLSENTYTWDNAQNHCADLNSSNYGGKSNWRVPNPLEFMTIVDNSTYNPATNSNFTGMPTYSGDRIWTSAEYKGNTSYAYAFEPYYGYYYGYDSTSYSKTKTYKVLCVSGDEMQPATSADFTSLTISGADVVTDSRTGLIWQKEYVTGKTWQEALSYCEDSTYAGYSDWRLPNKNELASLVNYEKSDSPYSYFPDMPSEYFWSSSTYVNDTDGAWDVLFNDGFVADNNKTYTDYVRCVR